jgi:ABC-2 type transport system permease protein
MAFLVVVMVPDVTALNQMVKFLETLPPFLLHAVGAGDDLTWVATPDGFIAVGFMGKALLLFAAYPVLMGLRVTAGEEDGTLDVLLALPVPRWRVLVEKTLAYILTTVVIVVIMFGGLWLGTVISGVQVNLGAMAAAMVNVLPGTILVLAFTILIAAFNGSRRRVLLTAAAFVIVSFMLDTVGAMATGSWAESLRGISFFSYFDVPGVVRHGLIWGDIAVLLGAAALMFGLSLWRFQRRDVGV